MKLTVDEVSLDRITADATPREPGAGLLWSLQTYGQLTPIRVRAAGDGTFELRDGHRRLAGARLLRWNTLKAVVEPAGAHGLPNDLYALLVNTQQERLTQLHVARRVRRLVEQEGRTQAELARELRWSESTLSWILKVARHPDLMKAVEEDELEWGAAKALTGLSLVPRTALLAELRAAKEGTGDFPPVRQIEEMVRVRQGKAPLPAIPAAFLPEVLIELMARGLSVKVRPARGKQTEAEVILRIAEGDAAWVNAFEDARKGGEAIEQM